MRFRLRTGVAPRERITGVASKPGSTAEVTVVVPAYNYARYLSQCAQSVLSQRDVDVRLVIADDCSTDDTPRVTAQLAASDSRVTVIRNPENRGHIPTVDAAMEVVRTEFVVKLDADDLLPPGALARATALLQARRDVAFVYGRPRHFDGAVPRLRDRPARSWTVWHGEEWIAARCESSANVISQPEVVMRTALARQAGWLCPELEHTSDMHLWLTLATMGNVGRINGPAQGLYRVHDASMQRTIHKGMMIDLEGRRDAFERALGRSGALNDAERLLSLARRGLAVTALDCACRAYDRGQTNIKPVDELVAFALDVYPPTRAMREWRAFEQCRSVGEKWAPRHPLFFARAITRRLAEEVAHLHWLRTGEV